MQHVLGKRAYGILVRKPEAKDHFEDPGVDDNIKLDLQEVAWTGLIWLRIGTGGGHL